MDKVDIYCTLKAAEIREIAYKNIKGNAKFNYRIVMLEMLEIFEKFIDKYEKY